MAIWYVNEGLATGNNDGTSAADAFQSLSAAISSGSISAGDTVKQAKGTPTTTASVLNFNVDGSADDYTTWESCDENDSYSYSPGLVIDGQSTSQDVLQTDNAWLIKGIEFKDPTRYCVNNVGVTVVFYDCIFTGGTHGFFTSVGGDLVNCTFRDQATAGGRGANTHFRNCLFINSAGTGLDCGGNVSAINCVFDNCVTGINMRTYGNYRYLTFYDCGTGASVNSGAPFLAYSVFHSCTTGLEAPANDGVFEDYCVFYNCTADRSEVGQIYNLGNSVSTGVDPLTDPANGDFSRVASTSIYNSSEIIGAPHYSGDTTTAYVTAGGASPEIAGSGGSGGGVTSLFRGSLVCI